MDRKSIIVIVGCLALLVLWTSVIVPKLYPRPTVRPGEASPASVAQTSPAAGTTGASPAAVAATISATAPKLVVSTNVEETLVVVSNENARYTFTSHGGGLKMVELLKYPETVARRKGQAQTNRVATLNAQSPAPALAVLDGEAVQGDGVFNLTATATGVRAEKLLPSGLVVVKEFALSTNYLVSATVRIENRSANEVSLPAQRWIVGTATPMSAEDKGESVGTLWFNGAKSEDIGDPYFANRTLGCIPGTPRSEFIGGQSNVVWAAVHNQFFALAAMPLVPASYLLVHKVELPRPSDADIRENSRIVKTPVGYQAALVYPELKLAPEQAVERQFFLFAGPKEYQTLARISTRFNNGIDQVMGFGGFFGFFSKGLLLGMNWLHHTLNLTYGWAIIVITVIIKVLFWPLTQASTRSMKRLSALQPQMKAIQEKYKDDPAKMNRKVMEFMKENKVNPMGGCLPMLLQMPVFIGFFYMIRSAIELRGARFLWVADLSQPDTLFMIPGLNFPFNLLPLIMGATMLWQAHLTPPSPGMDPMQQKIMKYMPMMFMVFLYNFSAGLTLYWTVQNLLTIAQTKLTKTMTEPTPPAKAPVLTPAPKKKK